MALKFYYLDKIESDPSDFVFYGWLNNKCVEVFHRSHYESDYDLESTGRALCSASGWDFDMIIYESDYYDLNISKNTDC